MSEEQKLAQGQTIWAEYQVQNEMSLTEARELIRKNAPTSFQVKEVSSEPFTSSGSH